MKKKIFFIHVAKTAGSSFNNFLQNHFKGEIHCEKYLEQDKYTLSNIDYLKSLDYISGHLKIPTFYKNNFAKQDYFLIAYLRNPVNQFLSHINWIIKISTMGENFFMTHSQRFRDISLELGEANLYDPDVFISSMIKFQGIFKNNQSVYFVSDPMEVVSHAPSKSSSEIIEAMQVLDLVGITEYYQDSLKTFAVLNNIDIDIDIKVDKVNQNLKYKLGKDILENPLIYEFIQEYNQIDIEVYNHFFANYQNKLSEQQLCK
jgi:hypothetical protein